MTTETGDAVHDLLTRAVVALMPLQPGGEFADVRPADALGKHLVEHGPTWLMDALRRDRRTIATLTAERDQAIALNRVNICAYCRAEFPRTEGANPALVEHVVTCTESPFVQARAADRATIAGLRAAIVLAGEADPSTDTQRCWCGRHVAIDGNHTPGCVAINAALTPTAPAAPEE